MTGCVALSELPWRLHGLPLRKASKGRVVWLSTSSVIVTLTGLRPLRCRVCTGSKACSVIVLHNASRSARAEGALLLLQQQVARAHPPCAGVMTCSATTCTTRT